MARSLTCFWLVVVVLVPTLGVGAEIKDSRRIDARARSPLEALPAEQLFGTLMSELTEPQHRCHWAAGQLPHLEGIVSLYRQDSPTLVAEVDERRLGDSTGIVRSLVFETRLLGPATVTLTLHAPSDRLAVQPGQQLGITLRDGRGELHPLFCGVVFDRRRIADGQLEVSALIPRAGRELARSRRFNNMRVSEVVSELAQEAGLEAQIDIASTEPLHETLSQRNVADWLFMRRLAASEDMDLILMRTPRLRYAPSAFTAPEQPPARVFTDMTWVDVVSELAQELGLQPDVQVHVSVPAGTFRQSGPNLRFAQALAARHGHSVFVSGDALLVRDDGIWRPNPALGPDQRMKARVDDLAAGIARRHGLTITLRVPRQPVTTLTRRSQTDSEFLLAALAAHGLHLEHRNRVLVLQPARAPGDVADLLLSRVTVLAGGRPGRLSRSYGEVRQQLMDPIGVPGRGLTLELGGRPAIKEIRATPIAARRAGPPLDTAAGDVGRTARSLDDRVSELGKSSDPRERFLAALARVYRPTLLFLHRIDS